MSLTNREILSQFLDTVRNDIITEHISQGQRVTGRTLESLEISVTDYYGALYGAGYIGVLEDGRRPGKRPPVSVIEQWIINRGIVPKGKISILGLAFIMARKIGAAGTVLNQKGGKSGVLSKAINQERIDSLVDTFADKYISEIASEVVDVHK
jgi:hypothetical protein